MTSVFTEPLMMTESLPLPRLKVFLPINFVPFSTVMSSSPFPPLTALDFSVVSTNAIVLVPFLALIDAPIVFVFDSVRAELSA